MVSYMGCCDCESAASYSNHRAGSSLERVPLGWNRPIDQNAFQINKMEHVLIEKGDWLFRNMLWELRAGSGRRRFPAPPRREWVARIQNRDLSGNPCGLISAASNKTWRTNESS
jgi:hypothetical protein